MSYEDIKEEVKVCMFDQYGTVVDMQGGLTAIASPFLKEKGWMGNFDKVISVAEANSFKPHVATYTKAAEILGFKPDQILFVANHAAAIRGS